MKRFINNKIRVLILHPIGTYGGASKSIYELVKAVPSKKINFYFLTQKGNVEQYFEKVGTVISSPGLIQFSDTKYGFYRGVRWFILIRELYYFMFTIWALIKLRINTDIDIIHLNEITGLPTLILAKLFFKIPTIVHVRSLARNDLNSKRSKFILWYLKNQCDKIIAIDENVKSSLSPDLKIEIIYNILNTKIIKKRIVKSTNNDEILKIGFVGSLHRAKGVLEIAKAFSILLKKNYNLKLIIAGSSTHKKSYFTKLLRKFNLIQDCKDEFIDILSKENCLSHVEMLGFLDDVSIIYRKIDVLCFPSHYNAPGRPVMEAALFSVPSIVAVTDPKNDTIQDKVTGLTIKPRCIDDLIVALEFMINRKKERIKMGENAYKNAIKKFDQAHNSKKIINIYNSLISANS